MIANARMYSVSPEAAGLWRRLLAGVIEQAGLAITLLEHTDPQPIDELWERPDMAAVFMCGLPFSRAHPRPLLVAAPVPAAPEFAGLAQYWSEWVVRKEGDLRSVEDSFGGRLALTVPNSQSGCLAALHHLQSIATRFPVYGEVIEPRITPLGAVTAVIEGRADIAPIDCYAFRLLQAFRRDLTSRVRIIGRTPSTAIPALVGSRPAPPSLRDAFLTAHCHEATAPLMHDLQLAKFVQPLASSYDALRADYESTSRFWAAHALATTVHPAFDLSRS